MEDQLCRPSVALGVLQSVCKGIENEYIRMEYSSISALHRFAASITLTYDGKASFNKPYDSACGVCRHTEATQGSPWCTCWRYYPRLQGHLRHIICISLGVPFLLRSFIYPSAFNFLLGNLLAMADGRGRPARVPFIAARIRSLLLRRRRRRQRNTSS